MKRKKIIWLIILLAVFLAAWYFYKEYTRTHKNLSETEADVKINAIALIKEFETNDTAANLKYTDKVIETSGAVKDIEKEGNSYTLVLGEQGSTSSVRCSMDTLHTIDAATLKPGSSVVVRGECAGFNTNEDLLGIDLGADVELKRCVIIK